MKILIKNGTVVNADMSASADVLIMDCQIERVGTGIEKEMDVDKIIDAGGCYIFPGAIDPHVHFNLKTPTGNTTDDFYTGSVAALFGGTTSMIDFVTPERGKPISLAFSERKKEASKSLIDYKLHVSPVEWTINTEEEIKRCVKDEGVVSFKVYMAYKDTIGLTDGAIFKVMKTVSQHGGLVTIHCEMGNEIENLRNQFYAEGKVSVKYHPLSRPAVMEHMAVKRIIDIASKAVCPIYIVHVSSKISLEYIRMAQSRMQAVYAETCPQYLLFNDGKYKGDFEETSPYVFSPPLRKDEDVNALWRAIADGTIQAVGTDHCSFNLEQKKKGIDDFRKIPNGAGGIEHRLELLYTYGVLQKKISINRMIDLVSTMPAKIFGLYSKKGIIEKGSDADLVIWDPNVEREISVANHHMTSDLNIYKGVKILGQARDVFVRGKMVIENARLISESQGLYMIYDD